VEGKKGGPGSAKLKRKKLVQGKKNFMYPEGTKGSGDLQGGRSQGDNSGGGEKYAGPMKRLVLYETEEGKITKRLGGNKGSEQTDERGGQGNRIRPKGLLCLIGRENEGAMGRGRSSDRNGGGGKGGQAAGGKKFPNSVSRLI